MTAHCGGTAINADLKNWESETLCEPSFGFVHRQNPLIFSAETYTCHGTIYRKRNPAETELFNNFGAETEIRSTSIFDTLYSQDLVHNCKNSGYGFVFQLSEINVDICTVYISKRTLIAWTVVTVNDSNSRIACCIHAFSAVLSEVVSSCNSQCLHILSHKLGWCTLAAYRPYHKAFNHRI